MVLIKFSKGECETIVSAVIYSKTIQHHMSMVFLSYKIFIIYKSNKYNRNTHIWFTTNLCKTLLYLLLIFIAHAECQRQNVMLKSFLKKCKRPLNNKYKLLIQMNLPETAGQTGSHACHEDIMSRRFSFSLLAPVVQVQHYYYYYYLLILYHLLIHLNSSFI